MYISHMRSEGNQLVEAVDELIKIAREAKLPAEIYHLKAAGKENWAKRDKVIELVEAARERKDCGSRPTCIRTPPARPA